MAWLKQQPEELLTQTIPSSFSSIRETLVHIWDVERSWLAILQQTPPPPSFRMNGFEGMLDEVFNPDYSPRNLVLDKAKVIITSETYLNTLNALFDLLPQAYLW